MDAAPVNPLALPPALPKFHALLDYGRGLYKGFCLHTQELAEAVALFTAAGIPMIIGDMLRSAKDQEARLKEEVHKAKEEAKAAKTRRGPRDWPNFAKDVRDDTAEDLNRLLSDLAKAKGETDPHKLTLLLAHTQIVLHTSLRRLESVDAPTRPPQL